MNQREKLNEAAGNFGEQLLRAYFILEGWKVHLSEDKYDQEKDMVIYNDTKEYNVGVKLEMPYHFCLKGDSWIDQACFTVNMENKHKIYSNQLTNVLSVDIMIFISKPHRFNNYKVELWELPAVNYRKYVVKTLGNKRKIACFPIKDMKLLKTLGNKKLIEKINSLDSSNWE